MKISKTFVVACAVGCCAGSISLAAPDSISQAQAREALRQKIAELNAQQPVAETPAPVTKPAQAPKAVAAPKPVTHPEPVVVSQPPVAAAPAAVEVTPPPTAALPRATSEQLARQREALRQKIAELNTQEKAGQPAPAPASVTTIVKSPDTKSADVIKAEQVKARQEKMAKSKSAASPEFKSAQFAPVQAPALALPASQEAKLNELLRQYKADAITPEEYHKARAKILAGP